MSTLRRLARWWRSHWLRGQIAYCQNLADDLTFSNTLRSHYRVRAWELREQLRRLYL
jgi:hypothetical protein